MSTPDEEAEALQKRFEAELAEAKALKAPIVAEDDEQPKPPAHIDHPSDGGVF